MERLEDLWNQHRKAPFPSAGKEIQGIDLVLLDAYAAGCIQVFLDNDGRGLDERRIALLAECHCDLGIIQPLLESEAEQAYFSRLEKMVAWVLEWIITHGGMVR